MADQESISREEFAKLVFDNSSEKDQMNMAPNMVRFGEVAIDGFVSLIPVDRIEFSVVDLEDEEFPGENVWGGTYHYLDLFYRQTKVFSISSGAEGYNLLLGEGPYFEDDEALPGHVYRTVSTLKELNSAGLLVPKLKA